MSTDLFFVALLPPPGIQEEVTAFKQIAAERFQAKRALRSPPHITLIPPFRFALSEHNLLREKLKVFNQQFQPFSLALDGFAAFPPRVIYVDVVNKVELIECQKQLEVLCSSLGIVADRSHGFHPHMTVAFKDLKSSVFPAAWAYFQEQVYQREFAVTEVTLLQWKEGKWQPFDN